MTNREEFVVDDDDLAREEQTRNCRLILGVLAGDADSFQADIPNGLSDDKPRAVVEAAERLFRATGRSGQMNPDYAQTGVLRNAGADAWDAFVTFAPYACDATVWDIDGRRIAELSDEGTAIVVLLTSPQREAVAAIVGPRRLVPLKEWNARRRLPRRTDLAPDETQNGERMDTSPRKRSRKELMSRIGGSLMLLSGIPIVLSSWSWEFAVAAPLLLLSGLALCLLANRSVG